MFRLVSRVPLIGKLAGEELSSKFRPRICWVSLDLGSFAPVRDYGKFALPLYCPTGLLIAISVLTPHGRAIVLPVLVSMTYQVPFEGRHTAKSALPSPS